MKRFFSHPLFLSILTLVSAYVVFTQIISPPLPQSIVIQYMIIIAVAVVLVATFEDTAAKSSPRQLPPSWAARKWLWPAGSP